MVQQHSPGVQPMSFTLNSLPLWDSGTRVEMNCKMVFNTVISQKGKAGQVYSYSTFSDTRSFKVLIKNQEQEDKIYSTGGKSSQ